MKKPPAVCGCGLTSLAFKHGVICSGRRRPDGTPYNPCMVIQALADQIKALHDELPRGV